jgi:hypothetical protein
VFSPLSEDKSDSIDVLVNPNLVELASPVLFWRTNQFSFIIPGKSCLAKSASPISKIWFPRVKLAVILQKLPFFSLPYRSWTDSKIKLLWRHDRCHRRINIYV